MAAKFEAQIFIDQMRDAFWGKTLAETSLSVTHAQNLRVNLMPLFNAPKGKFSVGDTVSIIIIKLVYLISHDASQSNGVTSEGGQNDPGTPSRVVGWNNFWSKFYFTEV